MEKYYRTIGGEPVEISEDEARAQRSRNAEIFDRVSSGEYDFQELLSIDWILKVSK